LSRRLPRAISLTVFKLAMFRLAIAARDRPSARSRSISSTVALGSVIGVVGGAFARLA